MQRRDFETYQKSSKDFEILPKLSETLPWVPEDIFFLSTLMVRGEAGLTRKEITSGHRST